MEQNRNNWQLLALWLCVAYFCLLTAFALVTYRISPIALLSEYNPSTMTQDDITAIAKSFGKVLWRSALLTAIGTIALLGTAIWIQAKTPSRLS